MPLILSSNVIWHAYRLIAETKIFRLGLSLICILYVKEEWIGKKVLLIHYITIYYLRYNISKDIIYITSNTENSQAYLQQMVNSDNSIQINIKFALHMNI